MKKMKEGMRRYRYVWSEILCVCVCLVVAAVPTQANWKELKAIFGGRVDRIVVDAGGTLYITTAGGPFKSTDGGQTWVSAVGNLPTRGVTVMEADPVTAGKVYAATDQGLFRTADGGNTWTQLAALSASVAAIINNIAIAPTNTNYIFVGTWGSYVWRSLDGGASWSQRAGGLYGGWGGPSFIPAIAVDPTNASRVYTSTWRGYLFRSDDAATTWYQMTGGSGWANGQIYVSRSNPNVLYMTHDEYWFGRGTILKSVDYGNNWSNVGRPAGPTDAGQMAIDPTDPNIVYVTSSLGIHKTTTGGGSWPRIFYPLTGQTYMLAVSVNPANSAKVYGGSYYTGFYRSLDSGGIWTQYNTGIAGDRKSVV